MSRSWCRLPDPAERLAPPACPQPSPWAGAVPLGMAFSRFLREAEHVPAAKITSRNTLWKQESSSDASVRSAQSRVETDAPKGSSGCAARAGEHWFGGAKAWKQQIPVGCPQDGWVVARRDIEWAAQGGCGARDRVPVSPRSPSTVPCPATASPRPLGSLWLASVS